MHLASWVMVFCGAILILFGPIIFGIGIPLAFFYTWLSLGTCERLNGITTARKFHITLLFMAVEIAALYFSVLNDEHFG